MKPDPIPPGHKANLKTIRRAIVGPLGPGQRPYTADDDNLGLVQAKVAGKDETHTLLCAFLEVGGEIVMTPLAQLFDGNPYELYEPPV